MQAGWGRSKEYGRTTKKGEYCDSVKNTTPGGGGRMGVGQLKARRVFAGSESIQSEQMKIQLQFLSRESRINGKHSAS